MKNTKYLKNISVAAVASIIFGISIIVTFFFYQLLDNVAVLVVACGLFAVLGALEYVIVKKVGIVIASSVLSMVTVFLVCVVFLGADDGVHWLNAVSVSALLFVPVIALVAIFPIAFASVGALVIAFIYDRLLKRDRNKDTTDIKKDTELPECSEKSDKIEEQKSEKRLFAALIPVFAIYWVSCLLFVFFESLILMILIPILCIFLGAWTRKRTQKLIAPIILHFSSTFLVTVLVYVPLNFIKSLIEGKSPRYFPPENLPELFASAVLLALAVSAFYVFGLFFSRMVKRLRSFNDDDAKMPLGIKRILVYIIFIFIIVVAYAIFFLANVDMALEREVKPGGIIPGSLMFGMLTFAFALVFIAVAFVFKVIFFKCRFSILLLCAIIVPYVMLSVNISAFSGPLASSVEEGGALYFVVNRDFNFDGYNDKQYRKMTKTHTQSGGYYGSDISFVWYVTGKGSLGYISFNENKNELKYKADGELSKLKIYVEFNDDLAENVEIYRIDGNRYESAEIKKVNSRTFKIVLDKDECAEVYNDNEKGFEVIYRIIFSDSSVSQ